MDGNVVEITPKFSFKSKKIAILYSEAKREYFLTEDQYITEAEVYGRAKLVAPYFEKLGLVVDLLPGNADLPAALQKNRPDFVLNLVDSVQGKEHLSPVIPSLLELLNIPYVGTGTLGLALNANKFLTKKLMEQAGLPLPRYQLFSNPNDPIDTHLKFPLISKLNEIHGSVAITEDSVSENETQLRNKLRQLFSVYHQPVLVEEFIVGRELTAYVLEGVVRKVYVGEKVFTETDKKYKMATFAAVWQGAPSYEYQRVDNQGILDNYARGAFDILKMDDYGKFDVRLDESGRYYFIDCNANPALGPVESDCAISNVLKLYGINFDDIVKRLITNVEKEDSQNNNNNGQI